MAWTIDGCISMQNLDIVRNGNRIAMIDCENEALSDGDIMANARLIAAAPDLLWTLEQVDTYLSPMDGEEDIYAEIRGVIHAAINKTRENPE
jgi:hypothetical protein